MKGPVYLFAVLSTHVHKPVIQLTDTFEVNFERTTVHCNAHTDSIVVLFLLACTRIVTVGLSPSPHPSLFLIDWEMLSLLFDGVAMLPDVNLPYQVLTGLDTSVLLRGAVVTNLDASECCCKMLLLLTLKHHNAVARCCCY